MAVPEQGVTNSSNTGQMTKRQTQDLHVARMCELPARRWKVNNNPNTFNMSQKGMEMSRDFGRRMDYKIWTGTLHPMKPRDPANAT